MNENETSSNVNTNFDKFNELPEENFVSNFESD